MCWLNKWGLYGFWQTCQLFYCHGLSAVFGHPYWLNARQRDGETAVKFYLLSAVLDWLPCRIFQEFFLSSAKSELYFEELRAVQPAWDAVAEGYRCSCNAVLWTLCRSLKPGEDQDLFWDPTFHYWYACLKQVGKKVITVGSILHS